MKRRYREAARLKAAMREQAMKQNFLPDTQKQPLKEDRFHDRKNSH